MGQEVSEVDCNFFFFIKTTRLRQAWEDIVAEWAAEESYNEEFRGAPEILADVPDGPPALPTQLRRLRGKQAPRGAWCHVRPHSPEEAAEEQMEEEGREVEEPQADIEGEGLAQPERKKPRKDSRVCPGRSRARPCIFAQKQDQWGQAARLDKGKNRCQFCDVKSLAEVAKDPIRKGHITRALRTWKEAGREDISNAALALIPEDARASFLHALKRPSRAAPAVEARAKAKAEANKEERTKALEQRQWLGGAFNHEQHRSYRQKTTDDERRLRKKFGPLLEAQAAEDDSWYSKRAKRFEDWCLKDSWGICGHCHRMVKRALRETNITGKKAPSLIVQSCGFCKKGSDYQTVAHGDLPSELQNLSDSALWALQPLHPDVGFTSCARHGYRVHTDMIRFWWNQYPVAEQIEWLEDEVDKVAARAAYRYLMAAEDSSYKDFVAWHNKFLRRYGTDLARPGDRKLQLPRRVLEEEGIECAVWPHLYPRTKMCETYVRKQDVRRLERAAAIAPAASASQASQAARLVVGPSSSTSSTSASPSSSGSSTDTSSSTTEQNLKNPAAESDEETSADEDRDPLEEAAPLDFARQGRNSAKSAYLAKVLGPVLGYGATYELFQFVYDLWLWSSLGGKKNTVGQEGSMRMAMAGYSFSPEYWRTRHAALIDMVKQLGLPTMFITVAPYEWSFPYHQWVEDEAKKLLRARLQLPVAETLHIAHVLAETVLGFLTGFNQQTTSKKSQKKAWKCHVFAAQDGSGRKTVLNFFWTFRVPRWQAQEVCQPAGDGQSVLPWKRHGASASAGLAAAR